MGDDGAQQVHDELAAALEAVREHERLSARLERATAAEETAAAAVAQARRTLLSEQADVRALESFSPGRVWATLKGSRDTDLEREQAEQQAAEYAVARAEADHLACHQETQRAEAELAALGDVRGRRERALAAKESWLRSVPGPAGERLAGIADELAAVSSDLKETAEAVAAGEAAAGALERARRTLGAAGDWATYDTFFGGGMVGDAMKYRRMDEAQQLLHAADRALQVLATELADVGVNASIADLSTDGLTQTFDVWFDNIFTDWSVRDRITRAARRTDEAARVVHEVRTRLARRTADLESRRHALAQERETLLTH